MKILVSWLREFVDVTAPPEELGQMLSMRGFELASVGKRQSRSDRSTDRRWTIDDATMPSSTSRSRRTGRTALSVLGLAREAATAYSLPLRAAGAQAPVHSR